MQLVCGSYSHADNEVTIAVTKEPVRNSGGQTLGIMERWSIDGQIQASTQAALTTAMAALETAYRNISGDLLLYDNTPAVSHHAIYQSQTIGGIRLAGPIEWINTTGAEYSTFRTYRLIIEAQIPVSRPTDLVSWREVISVRGGGPRRVAVEYLEGPPELQTVVQSTAYFASQSGQAVGYTAFPLAAPPLWPDYLTDGGQVERGTPERLGSSYANYPISWTYEFASPQSLTPSMSPWPANQ